MKAKFVYNFINEEELNSQSPIDKQYSDFIIKKLIDCKGEECRQWAVYNDVLTQLKKLGKQAEVTLLKNKVVNGYDPRDKFLNVLYDLDSTTSEIEKLIEKIENF